MRLLLDSHAVLWFFQASPQLSALAKATIEDAQNEKFVSVATCWELAIKAGLGRFQLTEPIHALLSREITRNNFQTLDISVVHATSVESLPHHHRDPFDRLLIVQALAESLTVVGRDSVFDQYGVARVW